MGVTKKKIMGRGGEITRTHKVGSAAFLLPLISREHKYTHIIKRHEGGEREEERRKGIKPWRGDRRKEKEEADINR